MQLSFITIFFLPAKVIIFTWTIEIAVGILINVIPPVIEVCGAPGPEVDAQKRDYIRGVIWSGPSYHAGHSNREINHITRGGPSDAGHL